MKWFIIAQQQLDPWLADCDEHIVKSDTTPNQFVAMFTYPTFTYMLIHQLLKHYFLPLITLSDGRVFKEKLDLILVLIKAYKMV
jgi:hypothetical protein